MTEKRTPLHSAPTLLCAAIWAFGMPNAHATHVGEELVVDQQAVVSSDQLLGALRQYERVPPEQRAAVLQRLTQLAATRRERMLALFDRNPNLAALRVMPQAVRARIPGPAQGLVERPVALNGTVVATIADDFANRRSTKRFEVVDVAGQRFEFRVANASERDMLAMVGKRGAITAMQLDRHLLVLDKRTLRLAADGTQTTGTTAATTASVLGDQSTLVVMLNFNDKALTCTGSDLQSRLFGTTGATMNVGYLQSSGNQVSFSGQVVGPFTIDYGSSSTSTCDPSAWANAANGAAIAVGFNPANYKRVSYAMPSHSNCPWSGLATLGGTPPTPSWVQSCASTGVFSHELGHNLQFHHASTPTSEYGDSSDPMGGALLVQSNAANRVMAGWVAGSQVQDVGSSGSYAVQALENMASPGPLVLRMPKPDTAETYYVSLRQGTDLDAGLPSGYLGALSVHRATGTLPARTFRVANLAAGQSWTDSVNGITVTHHGLTTTGASVGVSMGGATCAPLAPSITVSPASQSAAPGGTIAYGLAITNNNSTACGPSSFNLTQTLPLGFSGNFSAGSVTLSPGGSASVGWNVASSTSVLDATYTLSAAASDATAANSANTHASYVAVTPSVAPPPPPPPPTADTTPPTVAITNPAPNAVLIGRSLTLSATASDASGVAAVEFYVDGKRLVSDTTAPYNASWNLRKAGLGSHTIRVRALDTLGNAAEQSIVVSVN